MEPPTPFAAPTLRAELDRALDAWLAAWAQAVPHMSPFEAALVEHQVALRMRAIREDRT